MHKNTFFKVLLSGALLLLQTTGYTREAAWIIQSPSPDATVGEEDLLISAKVNEEYHIGGESQVKIFLNNIPISGLLKISDNKIHLLYSGPVRNGKNNIRVEAFIVELNAVSRVEWTFYAGKTQRKQYYNANDTVNGNYSLEGIFAMDYRKQFLSGSGQSLRQEPIYTATTLLEATARYKNSSIPVRVFMTSNNKTARQRMNYFSVGFRNNWIEADLGDMNPTFDELVLTGVRVTGGRLMLKYRGNSIQVCRGQLTNPTNGSIQTYVPGTSLNGSLINDSQYVAPGVYKRNVTAARLQVGSRGETYKLGLSILTAKDDTSSVNYGLLPKQNIVGGMDVSLNLFRRSISFDAGIAASILTNDISNGALDKETLDTTYNIQLDIDPKEFENIIILNASTVPTSLDNFDFTSYYGRLGYRNKYQQFSIEYKKNGALYYSLGNPFLRNNYQGIFVNERFYLYKRRINVGLTYQNYSNNLNDALPSRIYTKVYRGNVFINLDNKWPALYLNYMHQDRNGNSEYAYIAGFDDVLNNYTANLSYSKRFWNIDHYFYMTVNLLDRQDNIRIQNDIKTLSTSLGVNETFHTNYALNAEVGQVTIKDAAGDKIGNILTYNLGFNWLILPKKYSASVLLSNNQSFATTITNRSYRFSAILRFDWSFWRGMNLRVEGGHQPFRDQTLSSNSYNDSYIYVRYSSDLSKIF